MTDEESLQSDIAAVGRITIIDTILEVVCRTTNMGYAVVARVTDKRWIACAVRDEISFGLGIGGELPIETTLCHEVKRDNCEVVIDNVDLDPVYANHHTPAMYGLQSYISMPIWRKNGTFFGTLCAIDPKPAELSNPKVIGMFRLYADLISFHLATDQQLAESGISLQKEKAASAELKSLSASLVNLNNQLIVSNKQLQQNEASLRLLYEELGSANEEITASNEELLLSQDKLRESEQQFRTITDNIAQLAWMADGTGSIYWYNKRWYDYTGSNLDEMNGWGWQKVHHPDHVNRVTDKFKAHVISGELWEDTFPILGIEGQYRWFLSRAVPNKNEAGQVTSWFGTNTDITEQMASRDELQSAYESLQGMSTNLNQAINLALIDLWSVDLNSGMLALTSRSKDIHGLAVEEEISYEDSLSLLSPEHRAEVDIVIQKAIKEAGSFTVEYMITPKDGRKPRWIKSTGQVYADTEGNAVRMQGLMADITEQKEDEQRKSDFIGMVSHELKTPLTSLNGYIQLLQSRTKKFEDAFVTGSLDKANRQIGKMTKMINGFLNVSRFESGKIHIDQQQFDMKDLVRDIEEETVPANSTHNIIFAPVLSTMVNGDKDKIGQVITNFISNALKYSAPATTIQIACVSAEGCSSVSVRDEGMGIAEKDVPKLFDRYYRVEGHQMQTVSGFGIGLYLCAEIIERHQGKIWVESEPGKGSTFYFSIPLG